MIKKFVREVRNLYRRPQEAIYLIETAIYGNESQFINQCLDSGKVSTIGEEVATLEHTVAQRVGAKYGVATASGTAALHLALMVSGVEAGDLVITQPFTFVATANAIRHAGARPLFVDIDKQTLSISPEILEEYLSTQTQVRDDGQCYHRPTSRRVAACLPVHALGHPARIQEIVSVCDKYGIPVVEDAAEGLGSCRGGQSVGTFGSTGVFSFNGNKIVTCGGGGMLITNHPEMAAKAAYASTQAQPGVPEYELLRYNYRMPAINAALGLAQVQHLESNIEKKRQLTLWYQELLSGEEVQVLSEPADTYSNYWLQSLVFPDKGFRDMFVRETNLQGVITQPAWTLLHHDPLFASPYHGDLRMARWAQDHLAFVPSTIRTDD